MQMNRNMFYNIKCQRKAHQNDVTQPAFIQWRERKGERKHTHIQ